MAQQRFAGPPTPQAPQAVPISIPVQTLVDPVLPSNPQPSERQTVTQTRSLSIQRRCSLCVKVPSESVMFQCLTCTQGTFIFCESCFNARKPHPTHQFMLIGASEEDAARLGATLTVVGASAAKTAQTTVTRTVPSVSYIYPARLNVTQPPKKLAVIVGASYNHQSKFQLPNAANDVFAMEETLRDLYNFQEDHIIMLSDADILCSRPTGRNIMNALVYLTEYAAAGDVVLFYFSGAGTQLPSLQNPSLLEPALVPADFDAIRSSEFVTLTSQFADGVDFLFFFDCFWGTNPAQSPPGVVSRNLPFPLLLECLSAEKGAFIDRSNFAGHLSPDKLQELQSTIPKTGGGHGVLVSACAEGQVASECFSQVRNEMLGVLTESMLSVMTQHLHELTLHELLTELVAASSLLNQQITIDCGELVVTQTPFLRLASGDRIVEMGQTSRVVETVHTVTTVQKDTSTPIQFRSGGGAGQSSKPASRGALAVPEPPIISPIATPAIAPQTLSGALGAPSASSASSASLPKRLPIRQGPPQQNYLQQPQQTQQTQQAQTQVQQPPQHFPVSTAQPWMSAGQGPQAPGHQYAPQQFAPQPYYPPASFAPPPPFAFGRPY
eukprot:TRINITY_DN11021_c0_g1_i1.p1 TRINITY_DN11021_c0_g1~~TRINITY_DN11021_c0_g1_i1.p1  ORF type:complete len:609 (-),score=119.62 TRINITY_DN11021_c0_g1_i1:18-1844(-)